MFKKSKLNKVTPKIKLKIIRLMPISNRKISKSLNKKNKTKIIKR